MEDFFDIQDFKIKLRVENLAIKEFKDLVTADKSKSKNKALDQFLYIYMMHSYKSPYRDFPDEVKEKSIINDVLSEKIDTKDPMVIAAINKYLELNSTPSIALLNSAKNAMYKSAKHLDSAPISSGKDGNITQITATIDKMSKTIQSYDSIKQQVEKETATKGAMRGNIKLGNRED